jgi:ABC-2 type transport system ATP-binding protein
LLVETHALTKRYREVAALEDCTLEVAEGEVFGLLGPNGAGKTTLLRLLLGFLRPTAGKATIAGLDCYRHSVRVHERVSYLPGDARLFRQMRGRDVLRFFADVRPGGDLARSRKLAERLDLDLSRMVAFMSTGMRQKLALAAALASDTPLVILDEPTSNLDPTIRGEVAAMVLEARRAGRTVLFSSHVLSEVEEVCDRVVILRRGRLVHVQAMTELRRKHRIRCILRGALPPPPEDLASHMTIQHEAGGGLMIETPDELSPLLGWLATLPLEEVRIEPVGLRAVYDRFHS